MKIGGFIFLVGLVANISWGQSIESRYLKGEEPISMPLSAYTTITITFPGELEGISGAGFTTDYSKKPGDYVLEYVQGARHLSIIPVSNEVPPRNLNVVYGGNTYVFIPYIASKVEDSWLALNLYEKPVLKEANRSNEIKRLKGTPNNKFEQATPARLLGMIDSLKLISGTKDFSKQKELVKLMDHLECNLMMDQKMHYGDYILSIDKVIRNKKIDALCFEVSIQNLTSKALYINPESFSVRVGSSLYNQVLSDVSVDLKGLKTQKGYFVIVGNGGGQANWLSVNNRFQASMDIIKDEKA